MSKDKRWWLSFLVPALDYRPIYKGGAKSTVMDVEPMILGWWCSGENASGEAILCALMLGKSEAHVRNIVLRYWPEAKVYPLRDIRQVEDGWLPSDRFPIHAINEKIARETSAEEKS